MADLGKVLVALGLLIALAGLVVWAGWGRGWLGQSPGDIRVSRGNARFFFPVTTCLVLSVIVSLLLGWLRK